MARSPILKFRVCDIVLYGSGTFGRLSFKSFSRVLPYKVGRTRVNLGFTDVELRR